MSTESTTPPHIPLPSPIEQALEKTFDVPSILFAAERDAAGLLTVHVRNGKAIQITGRLVSTATEQPPPDESEEVFRIRSFNTINVGQGLVSVISDDIALGDFQLPATVPSASTYRALLGKEVMTYFRTRRSETQETQRMGREYFVTDRLYITLP